MAPKNTELVDWTMDDIVRKAIERELDGLIQGKSIKDRLYLSVELAARWGYARGLRDGVKQGS